MIGTISSEKKQSTVVSSSFLVPYEYAYLMVNPILGQGINIKIVFLLIKAN